MGEAISTGAPVMGAPVSSNGVSQTPAQPSPEPLTADAVKAMIAEGLGEYAKKINGEVAKVRYRAKSATPEHEAAPSPAVTMEDLTASREIGRLEAQLGDKLISALGDDYSELSPREQARMLRMLVRTRDSAETAPAAGSPGVTPLARTAQTSRAEPSAPRAGPAHPRTKAEYMQIAREDRARFQALRADPLFDPSDLE